MKVGEFYSNDLTDAISDIAATFTGEDGGGSFVSLCTLLREMDKRALSGDEAARKVTDIIRQFHKFIKLSSK